MLPILQGALLCISLANSPQIWLEFFVIGLRNKYAVTNTFLSPSCALYVFLHLFHASAQQARSPRIVRFRFSSPSDFLFSLSLRSLSVFSINISISLSLYSPLFFYPGRPRSSNKPLPPRWQASSPLTLGNQFPLEPGLQTSLALPQQLHFSLVSQHEHHL